MTGEFDPLDVKKVSESQKCAQSVLSSNERHKFLLLCIQYNLINHLCIHTVLIQYNLNYVFSITFQSVDHPRLRVGMVQILAVSITIHASKTIWKSVVSLQVHLFTRGSNLTKS